MWFLCEYTTSWKDERDSSYRVAPSDRAGYRAFLLNPNRISDLEEGDDNSIAVPTSKFKYFDNHLNPREKYGIIKARISVATIINAADTAYESAFITLPMFRNNNPDNATTDVSIPVSSLAFAQRDNVSPLTRSWVVYYNAAFKRREVLVDYNLEQLEDIAETGSTTTTTV